MSDAILDLRELVENREKIDRLQAENRVLEDKLSVLVPDVGSIRVDIARYGYTPKLVELSLDGDDLMVVPLDITPARAFEYPAEPEPDAIPAPETIGEAALADAEGVVS